MEDASAGSLLKPPTLAVVGGGWAGLAAAITAVQLGWQVHVFEASPHWGGRARSWPQDDGLMLDNGQHVLLGAYATVLGLMRTVGAAPEQAFAAHALTLRTPQGLGLQWPRYATRRVPAWAAQAVGGWAMLHAVWGAKGWAWRSRWALLRATQRWQAAGFKAPAHHTVADLCQGLPAQVMQGLIEPLCVSALNIAPARASAQLFLRVLQDGLLGEGWGPWSASAMLVPNRSLHETFVAAAMQHLRHQGAQLHQGQRLGRVTDLARAGQQWQVQTPAGALTVEAVVLACPAGEAARLAAPHAPAWAQQASALAHTAIATVYTQPLSPMTGMLALSQGPAQFVFAHPTHWAWVISDAQGDRQSLTNAVVAQARAEGWPQPVQVMRTVVEKRATWACTPDTTRPSAALTSTLWVAGDWVAGPYPATLEGACLSGVTTAKGLHDAYTQDTHSSPFVDKKRYNHTHDEHRTHPTD